MELVNALTDSNIEFNEGEEQIDMCKGIEGLIKKGEERGKEIGKEIGEEIGALKFNIKLIEKGTFTIEQAAKEMNMTVEQFEEKVAKLKSNMENVSEITHD